jgi:ATP-binding cassette subfamily C (CFTR/MRP) protein 4
LLLQPEISDTPKNNDKNEGKFVSVKNLYSSWECESKIHENVSFKVEENELLAVVGPVGCGKSSLLLALLGEMPFIKGDIKLNGSVFYVTQEAWIFSSTIKQNILFGKEYSKEKFDQIIKLCALRDVNKKMILNLRY